MTSERTAIVTGASSGIGAALSTAAAADGYRVLLVARRADRLEEVARAISEAGGACATLATDVRASDAPSRIVTAALEAFSRVDVVVNNAGAGAFGSLLEQSDAAIEAQWQLHVAAPLRIARAAFEQLELHRGQLVFIGSGLARVPLPMYGAYAPVKAAIRAAAIQLRRELRPHGIAVTYVDPGLVDSEFHVAAGIERGTHIKPTPADRVARAILRGIARRSATVNAVPWQTAGTVLGEISSTLADSTISKLAPKPIVTPSPRVIPSLSRDESNDGAALRQAQGDTRDDSNNSVIPSLSRDDANNSAALRQAQGDTASFETALEPVARRMERVKLSQTFLRDALQPGATIELNDIAMRWAGMPNKNERAAMHEALDALTAGGYLEPKGDETWTVVRAAD